MPVFSLEYPALPVGSSNLSLDALLARQALLARFLLAASLGLGIASAFCEAVSKAQGTNPVFPRTVLTVIQLIGSSFDFGGTRAAVLGHWLIVVASVMFLLSPILLWIRSSSRNHLVVALGVLPLLIWIGVPVLFIHDPGWTWWNGLMGIQIAMTTASVAIVLTPRREQKIAMVPLRSGACFKLTIAAIGTAAGLFFAFAVASFLDVVMHSAFDSRDILYRLIQVGAFFGWILVAAAVGGVFATSRCARGKYFAEEAYGSCAGRGLHRQAQGWLESRETIE